LKGDGSPGSEEISPAFAAEVARARDSGIFGETGRLRELFEFLAARGLTSQPASQAEIAQEVFGQVDSDGDDATVRVYVHRLRKRLDQFYKNDGDEEPHGRLVIPSGAYALRLANSPAEDVAPAPRRMMIQTWLLVAALAVVTLLGFAAGRLIAPDSSGAPVNAIWKPFITSDRPILVVVGDYYMFGEIDPLSPEKGRLIRDFQIDSRNDLTRLQAEDPARYGTAEDVGLTYLPLSSADALAAVMPVLAHDDKPVRVIAASQLDSKMLSDFNVVYVGLLSGLHLLQEVNFRNSNIMIGETYDELIHVPSNGRFVSSEARTLPLPGYYTDYGYLSVFQEPGGGLVAIIAGERDTALRAIAPLVTQKDPPALLNRLARDSSTAPSYEALFEVTGQQGADFGERLLLAEPRPER
jgi:hypothetical protein